MGLAAVGHRAAQGDQGGRHRPARRTPTTATSGWPRWSPNPRTIQRPIITARRRHHRHRARPGDARRRGPPAGSEPRSRHPDGAGGQTWGWRVMSPPAAGSPDVRGNLHRPRVTAMARVVVIGGGYGGLASAARLAKIGHDVTLLEAGPRLGGAVGYVEQDGFRWDSGPTSTLLPAVLRDLFRKSGRAAGEGGRAGPGRAGAPAPLRGRHRARPARWQSRRPDRGGRRRRSEPGWARAGRRTSTTFADDWEALRRDWLERPYSAEHASKHTKALLSTRLTLHKVAAARPSRTSGCATSRRYPMALEGHDLRNVPAWMGMWTYVEQNFGAWTVPGGMGSLADALASRLRDARRDRAALHPGPRPRAVRRPGRRRAHRAAASSTPTRSSCAIDPRRLPALAPMRGAHDAGDPAGDLPRRHRRHGARPARRGGAARRPDAGAAHRRRRRPRARTRGRSSAAAGSPRTSSPPCSAPASGSATRSRSASTGRRCELVRGVGRFAVRRALAGPQHRHPPARPAHAGARTSTWPARTPPRAPGCPRSGSPPRWSRR